MLDRPPAKPCDVTHGVDGWCLMQYSFSAERGVGRFFYERYTDAGLVIDSVWCERPQTKHLRWEPACR